MCFILSFPCLIVWNLSFVACHHFVTSHVRITLAQGDRPLSKVECKAKKKALPWKDGRLGSGALQSAASPKERVSLCRKLGRNLSIGCNKGLSTLCRASNYPQVQVILSLISPLSTLCRASNHPFCCLILLQCL